MHGPRNSSLMQFATVASNAYVDYGVDGDPKDTISAQQYSVIIKSHRILTPYHDAPSVVCRLSSFCCSAPLSFCSCAVTVVSPPFAGVLRF